MVNLPSLSFMFTYVIMGFPSNYILDNLGLKLGLLLGSFLNLAGAWIRLFINSSFIWVNVG